MIARRMGIGLSTLTHYYRDDLDMGAAEATEAVARRMFNLCMSEDEKIAMSACSFWLKVRAKWRTTDVEANITQLNIQNNVTSGNSPDDDEIQRFKQRWEAISVEAEEVRD